MRYNDGRGPLPPAGLHRQPWKGIPADYGHRRRTLAETALYRFYASDGRLLYVGITGDLESRWRTHASTSPWWHLQASVRVEWFPNWHAADQAERAAVKTEKPLHNYVHATPGTGRKGARHLPEPRTTLRPSAPAPPPEVWKPDADQALLLKAVRLAASTVDAVGKSALPDLHRALDAACAAGVPGPVVAAHSKRQRRSAERLTESTMSERP